MSRPVLLALLCLAAPSAARVGQPAEAQPPSEARVKAAFLYRFPQFVEWPAAALASAATIDLCVVAPAATGADLQELVTGESLRGRPLRVRAIDDPDDLGGCHVLFADARAAAGRRLLRAALDRPILTVGDDEEFLKDGGVIAFRVVDRRVRFEVDLANARRAGLRLDVQLLRLALAVRGGPGS